MGDVTVGTLDGLNRYPVKSMQGEALDTAALGANGVVGDRAYALVDLADGKVASAKNPRKWGTLLSFSARFVEEPRLGEPPPPVEITFPDAATAMSDGSGIDRLLSDALGRGVHLATAGTPEAHGKNFEEVWPDIEGLAPTEFISDTKVTQEPDGELVSEIVLGMAAPPGSFFDLAVIHVLTRATLDGLTALAPGADFDPNRYRPNLLLGGSFPAFAENGWTGRAIEVGNQFRFSVSLPTMRCVMTTLAQPGLKADRSSLRAIADHNRIEIPGLGTWACAGAYGGVLNPGDVRIGDPVRLVD